MTTGTARTTVAAVDLGAESGRVAQVGLPNHPHVEAVEPSARRVEIGEHALDVAGQHRIFVQGAIGGGGQQRRIGGAVPQEERQPRCQLVVAYGRHLA